MTVELEPCPQCGGPLCWGYGLAGGGMGHYWYCDACEFFRKQQDADELTEPTVEHTPVVVVEGSR